MREKCWWRCVLVSALAVLPGFTSGFAEDREIVMRFAEISPDRSLPVVNNVPFALQELEAGRSRGVFPPNAPAMRAEADGGWKAAALPHPSVGSFDEYKVVILTDDPDRTSLEATALFQAIGFLPIDEYSDTYRDGRVIVEVSFFDDLAFFYGGPLPVIVLERDRNDRSYRYRSSTPSTIGGVLPQTLGGLPVFFFDQDDERTRAQMRREYPIPRSLILWDQLGEYSFRAAYDELIWGDDDLLVVRNTRSLDAPCGVGSSSYNCTTSGNACQYSLVNPISGEPAVLQTTIKVGYEGNELRQSGAILQLVSAVEFEGNAVTCLDFSTRAEILRENEFGVCGMNINGVSKWRCLGTSEGYLRESYESSLRYWLTLREKLNEVTKEVIEVDPALKALLDGLPANGQPDLRAFDPPRGLGYRDAFGLAR